MKAPAIQDGRCRKGERQSRVKCWMPAGSYSILVRLICSEPAGLMEEYMPLDRLLTLELKRIWNLLRIKYGINDRLPPDISIINVEEAHPKFHARHDANARSYIYQISRRRTAFGKKFVWWIKDQLDVEKMNEAAKNFPGLKDYRYFTDEDQEQSSTKVEILHASVNEFGDMIIFHVVGSHFLWKQVRRMTGVLVEVGRGKLSPAEVASFFRIKTDIPAQPYCSSQRIIS